MRFRPTLLLLLLIAAPLTSAATDPNASTLVEESGILAAVMAKESGRVLYSTVDPGDNVPDAPADPTDPTGSAGPGPAEATWFLISPGSTTEIETGDVDPAVCRETGQGRPFEDCQTDAFMVASNRLGTRLVIAGHASGEGDSSILLFQPTDGTPVRHEVANRGPIEFLDLAEDGTAAAFVYQTSALKWHLGYVGWNDDNTLNPWSSEKELPGKPTGFDLSEDGKVITVVSGEDYLRYSANHGTEAIKDDSFVGQGASVAVAANVAHTSVTGTTNGRLVIHVDSTSPDDQKLNIRRQDSSIDTVAITNDGTYIAWSNEAGTFGMARYDAGSNLFQILGETNIGVAADQISINDAGEVIAVLAGDDLHMFGRHDNTVYPLWKSAQVGNLGTVSMRDDGEHILVPHGDRVVLFEAEHKVNVTGNSPTLVPGKAGELTLAIRNDGNRLLTTPLAALPLAGWTAVPEADSVVIAPNETVHVDVAVTPASTASPGGYEMMFETLDPEGEVIKHRVNISLTTVVDWEMDVKEGKPKTLSVTAGEPGVFELTVSNKGNTEAKAPLKLEISDGSWTADITSGGDDIMPGTTQDLDITVTPPDDALELDEVTITVRMNGFDGPIELRAVVGAVFDVDIEIPNGITLIEGTTKAFNVTIHNNGNTADGADVTPGPLPQGWALTFDFGQTTATVKDIAASGSRTIKATLHVPLGESIGIPFQIEVHAKGHGNPLSPAKDNMLVTVEAVPEIPAEVDNDSPGAPTLFVVAAIGAAAWVARRRSA